MNEVMNGVWQHSAPHPPMLSITIIYKNIPTSIETGYGLDGPGSNPSWGARFSAPVQTGPGAHPASCTMGTGPFSGVKNGRGVTLTPSPPFSAVVKKE